jgi:hypothetical protein
MNSLQHIWYIISLSKDTRTYRVYPSLFEEMNEGYVWINEPELRSRQVVKITNVSKEKSIYCETRTIDKGFKKNYQKKNTTIEDEEIENILSDGENQIVISQWYRDDLDIDIEDDVDLKIEKTRWYGVLANYWASIQHPNVVSRIATRISVWGLILAILSLVVGIVPMLTDIVPGW